MKVSVLGCGRWGSFLAWYAASVGHTTTIWGREGSTSFQTLRETRQNRYLQLPEHVNITDSLSEAVTDTDTLLIAISAQELRGFCRQLAGLAITGKSILLCMKGLEEGTGRRLTQVVREEVGDGIRLGIWVGPGHVQEFLHGVPNCMVIDSDDPLVTRRLADAFSSPLIRFYYGTDLIGNEVGAAAKNVVGLAAGMLDGLGLSSLKGALMARGACEVSRLIRAMGGSELTAYGLGHLGDYEATLFSPHSHNRLFGEAFVRKEPFDQLAEGVPTAAALANLATKLGVDMPLCTAIHAVLTTGRDPQETLEELFLRPLKPEFERDVIV